MADLPNYLFFMRSYIVRRYSFDVSSFLTRPVTINFQSNKFGKKRIFISRMIRARTVQFKNKRVKKRTLCRTLARIYFDIARILFVIN